MLCTYYEEFSYPSALLGLLKRKVHQCNDLSANFSTWCCQSLRSLHRGLLSVSSQPRNGRGMSQNPSPRLVLDLKKQGSKVSSLKWLRKMPKFRGIPRLVLEKVKFLASPRLVLDLWKILPEVSNSSSPDDPSRTSDLGHLP